jgi:hypothetical protein
MIIGEVPYVVRVPSAVNPKPQRARKAAIVIAGRDSHRDWSREILAVIWPSIERPNLVSVPDAHRYTIERLWESHRGSPRGIHIEEHIKSWYLSWLGCPNSHGNDPRECQELLFMTLLGR